MCFNPCYTNYKDAITAIHFFFNCQLNEQVFNILPLTDSAQGLKRLNLVRCGTHKMFGLSEDILT